jgi:prolyl 4-hydroxylase
MVGENPVVANIERRISEITGYPIENGEGIQILRYEEGQEYRPHFDYFDPNSPAVSDQLNNNRVCTFLMYLNTPEEGGETIFPDAGLSVRAKQGSAVQFSYQTPSPDTKTLHAGTPVIKGEKWVATKWIRRKEYK